ncbi:MAG: hypothetical protein ACRDT0_02120 [Pseudonocardiaceae bacterium]
MTRTNAPGLPAGQPPHADPGPRLVTGQSEQVSDLDGQGRGGGTHDDEVWGYSIEDLIKTYRDGSTKAKYWRVRKEFEKINNGTIAQAYFAKKMHAGAVLLEVADGYKIRLAYDGAKSAMAPPSFEEVLWRTLCEERQSSVLLTGRPKDVVVQTVYSVVVYLLNVLDSLPTDESTDAGRERLDAAVASASRELDRLHNFVRDASGRASLQSYLFGLPFGIMGASILFVLATWLSTTFSSLELETLAVCLASGAIGAVVSVMTRTTRGQHLDVDIEQSPRVTVLTGSFRPIIGALFGAALFILVQGGLLPLTPPATASGTSAELFFFCGLAFIAGFSERWAQDTIVRSAPTVPAASSLRPAEERPSPART